MVGKKNTNLGNKNGVKLKDPKTRQEAFKSFCEWLAEGESVETWSYEENGLECCFKTMLRYIDENPTEFPTVKHVIARSKGQRVWEKLLGDSAKGLNTKASTASIQMIMRNKYGWDKISPNDREKIDTSGLKALSEFFREVAGMKKTSSPSSVQTHTNPSPQSTLSSSSLTPLQHGNPQPSEAQLLLPQKITPSTPNSSASPGAIPSAQASPGLSLVKTSPLTTSFPSPVSEGSRQA